MRTPDRIVVDTNVFVSAILLPDSIPRRAVSRVLESGVLLLSDATMAEVVEVLSRRKLDGYVSKKERDNFLRQLACTAEFIPVIQRVRECRDPKDDKFLELALNGRADAIVTGDRDLLVLNPWRGIPIVSPKQYRSR